MVIQKKEIPDSSIDFYQKLIGRRRDWQPIEPSIQGCVEGSKKTLQKALALSQLELPVGQWVEQELEKSLNKFTINLASLLRLNIEDETKHDRVLNSLIKVFPVEEEYRQQASSFVRDADKLAQAYSPIILAGVLEVSVFFVILPMFRFLGGSGFRTIANDISNDETIHVGTNIQLAQDLGYNRGKKVDQLRQDIIAWLTDDLDYVHDNKFLSAQYWQESSHNLYHSGKNSRFEVTKRAVMPAFFETDMQNLPVYS